MTDELQDQIEITQSRNRVRFNGAIDFLLTINSAGFLLYLVDFGFENDASPNLTMDIDHGMACPIETQVVVEFRADENRVLVSASWSGRCG
ncbi:MAG: hypothetical protein AAGL19_03035 [Pseudomonadota bacterium]